jgi:hypothetical protein
MKKQNLMLILLTFAVPWLGQAAPLSTTFSYQGRLTDGATPAEGIYDLQFILFNAAVGGSTVGNTNTLGDVPVTNGLFVVLLDFGGNAFAGDARWLEIGVRPGASGGAFTTLAPRQPLTAAPYALFAPTAGGVPNAAITSNMLATFAVNSSKIATGAVTSVQLADSIGLGSSNSNGRLDVYGTSIGTPALSLIGSVKQFSIYDNNGREKTRIDSSPGWGQLQLFNNSPVGEHAAILTANAVGGGSLTLYGSNGTQRALLFGANGGGALDLNGSDGLEKVRLGAGSNLGALTLYNNFDFQGAVCLANFFNGGGLFVLNSTNGQNRAVLGGGSAGGDLSLFNSSSTRTIQANGAASQFSTYGSDGQERVRLWGPLYGEVLLFDQVGHTETVHLSANANSGGQLFLRNGSGTTTVTLDANSVNGGKVTTQVLEITGGSDLSERFEVTTEGEGVQPGMVMCIDESRPGQLVPSTRAYACTVAGIVSGAGGIQPGMLMSQSNTAADGKHPVALTGRVYCLADAGYGAIRPGDLLTTSDTPGHAMAATDRLKASGAVLGKAMSELKSGKGLVLVLVSLQ